jgi:hypothetical protein
MKAVPHRPCKKLFTKTRIRAFGKDRQATQVINKRILPEVCLKNLLAFCYTGKYVDFSVSNPSGYSRYCMVHTYMYMLGKHYGVVDILAQAAKGFAESMQTLRSADHINLRTAADKIRNAAFFIELVYKLPGLDDADALRQEATKQAESIVGNMSIKISNEVIDKVIDKETRKHVEEMLPNVGSRVIARGTKPEIYELPENLDALAHATSYLSKKRERDAEASEVKCMRCREKSSGTMFDGLCESCFQDRKTMQRIPKAPANACMGVDVVLWECYNCGARWHTEGTRTQVVTLKMCSSCRAERNVWEPPKVLDLTGELLMKCSGCATIWHSAAPKDAIGVATHVYLCCPVKEDTDASTR